MECEPSDTCIVTIVLPSKSKPPLFKPHYGDYGMFGLQPPMRHNRRNVATTNHDLRDDEEENQLMRGDIFETQFPNMFVKRDRMSEVQRKDISTYSLMDDEVARFLQGEDQCVADGTLRPYKRTKTSCEPLCSMLVETDNIDSEEEEDIVYD